MVFVVVVGCWWCISCASLFFYRCEWCFVMFDGRFGCSTERPGRERGGVGGGRGGGLSGTSKWDVRGSQSWRSSLLKASGNEMVLSAPSGLVWSYGR